LLFWTETNNFIINCQS